LTRDAEPALPTATALRARARCSNGYPDPAVYDRRLRIDERQIAVLPHSLISDNAHRIEFW
jgi:hypothetical protein